MDKNNIKELSKICSPDSILVINEKGVFRLYVPFKATCVIEVESYTIGDVVTVLAVKMSNNYKLIYLIQNKAYYHHYFMIVGKPDATQTPFN